MVPVFFWPRTVLFVAVATLPGGEVPSVPALVSTPSLHAYDDAPRTADADDPAIWVHPRDRTKSLVLGTLKDAGLQVYDLQGRVLETIPPPNRPAISRFDPPAPGPREEAGTGACPDSADGADFGRFNNVAIATDFSLRTDDGEREVDIAVVTDRGCDRLRFYAIEADGSAPRFRDVTAPGAARIFPQRFVQPSVVQPGDEPRGLHPNPLEAQDTAYGLAVAELDDEVHVFVSQRNRSVIRELELFAMDDGTIDHRLVREYRFDPNFSFSGDADAPMRAWTPCREDPDEDPVFEGLVVDEDEEVLFASQETVGIWRIELDDDLGPVVEVSAEHLMEPVKSFGQPYLAVPSDDGYECEALGVGPTPPGAVAVTGAPERAGRFLVADVEGLALYEDDAEDETYLVASSQGDSTFHVYATEGEDGDRGAHVAAFRVEGVGATDGLDLLPEPLGSAFSTGLLVVHDGEALGPRDASSIAGFEYEGSSRFRFVPWGDVRVETGRPLSSARALVPELLSSQPAR